MGGGGYCIITAMGSMSQDETRRSMSRRQLSVRDLKIVVSYALPVLVLLAYRLILVPVICDDAFITFKTAINFTEGKGLAFNAGERVYLLTTPAWALLLALGRVVTRDVVIVAMILGTLFEVLFVLSTVHLVRILVGSGKTGMLAAIFVCANPVFLLTSFSGMELPLYLLLINLAFIFLARKRYSLSLVVASIAVWVRFDAVLLYALIFCWSFFSLRKDKASEIKSVFRMAVPSFLILIAYVSFGYFYYGDIVPTSVQRKMAAGVPLFSSMWLFYGTLVLREFANAISGKSAFWYTVPSLLWIAVVPFALGLIGLIRGAYRSVLPILILTLLYIAGFAFSGNSYATNFPWYFVPPLVPFYILTACGLVTIIEWIVKRHNVFLAGMSVLIIALIWPVYMYGPLSRDNLNLQRISIDRESMYGALTVWLGENIEGEIEIAGNEIGAMGFFARPGVKVLDLFGILRTKDERLVDFIELVNRHQPEAIITGEQFGYRKQIDEKLAGHYYWFKLERVELGLREDIAPSLVGRLPDVAGIRAKLKMRREYHTE